MQTAQTPVAAFDFDGTLADSNSAFIQFCREIFARYGSEPDSLFFERAKAMSLSELCALISRTLGGIPEAEQVQAELRSFLSSFYGNQVTLKPGVRAYLERLKRKGVRMCIVSATEGAYVRMAVANLGLEPFFETVVTPDQVGGRSKDRPEIFLEAACRMKANPASVTVYDDSLEALRTARTAGMRVIGVWDEASRDTAEEIRALCDGYIDSFQKALELDCLAAGPEE